MNEKEIISMILSELTEYYLEEHRKELAAANMDYDSELIPLSQQLNKVLDTLSAENTDIINRYIDKCSVVANKDCIFLYEQGAKDCVRLLKKLGII